MVNRSDWRWYGVAAHFICGQWCRFHLATQVGPWLVSTVGEYVHPRHSAGSEAVERRWLQTNWPGEEIGYGRKYETKVFRAGKPCDDPECNCGLPMIDGSDRDSDGYNTRGDAQLGHEALCEKWSSVAADAEPDMDDYTGPRGGEAAAEEAHRMSEARKLK